MLASCPRLKYALKVEETHTAIVMAGQKEPVGKAVKEFRKGATMHCILLAGKRRVDG